MIATIFALLIVFQMKHFVADFLLQGKYMLGKFKPGWDFVPPLAAHCAVHAIFTLMIVLAIDYTYWWLALMDFAVHFIMDRIKAGPKYLGKFKALNEFEWGYLGDKLFLKEPGIEDRVKQRMRSNTLFWWSLGLDQMVHSLTHYFIIFMLMKDMEGSYVIQVISTGLVLLTMPIFLPIIFLKSLIIFYFLYKFFRKQNKDVI